VEELRQHVEEWYGLDQQVIDIATREYCKRLQACVAADGEHFTHAVLTLREFAEMNLINIRGRNDNVIRCVNFLS